ncbi:hypothetical protein ZWY2020_015882 [Hordeum vulgare]|nr:hypothetical protein ZWY2020_015882 [Hordeum vulgare]
MGILVAWWMLRSGNQRGKQLRRVLSDISERERNGARRMGSNLVWARCKPCVECFNRNAASSTPRRPPTPLPCSGTLCGDCPAQSAPRTSAATVHLGDSSSARRLAETFMAKASSGRRLGCGDTSEAAGSALAGAEAGRAPLAGLARPQQVLLLPHLPR